MKHLKHHWAGPVISIDPGSDTVSRGDQSLMCVLFFYFSFPGKGNRTEPRCHSSLSWGRHKIRSLFPNQLSFSGWQIHSRHHLVLRQETYQYHESSAPQLHICYSNLLTAVLSASAPSLLASWLVNLCPYLYLQLWLLFLSCILNSSKELRW